MIKLSSLCTIQPRWNALAEPLISRSRSAQNLLRMETCKTCKSSLALPSTLRLEAARPGAAAHMSLHLYHYVKERKRPTPQPTPFSRGDLCAWFLMAAAVSGKEHRVGGVASMRGF